MTEEPTTSALPSDPFALSLHVGTISQITGVTARLLLMTRDDQASLKPPVHATASDYVIVKAGKFGIFGQITEVSLSLERKPTDGTNGRRPVPVGSIEFLATIHTETGVATPGISVNPRIGSPVYLADPLIVRLVIESRHRIKGDGNPVLLNLGTLPNKHRTPVSLPPERLFGSHCAVVGATGGGKSWTLARLMEETLKHKPKVILFDASGEYSKLEGPIRHVHVGSQVEGPESSVPVSIPYYHLTEDDLFAIFKPDATDQAPKLRAAMKSLKLARLMPILATSGLIIKADRSKVEFEQAYENYSNELENPYADFDLSLLTRQIQNECVFHQRSAVEGLVWGGINSSEHSNCIPLINRIQDIISSTGLAPIFRPESRPSIFEELHRFLKDEECGMLRISLRHLSFYHNAREIVANAIGRHLLELARLEYFQDHPLLFILDEAHQFLNNSLQIHNVKLDLDAFRLIAKEGRKYALSLLMATQRPRDIPEDILSQMGTMIIHRLVNDRDRAVVERASAEMDRTSASLIASLTPGEALIIGVDFPVPLYLKVERPSNPPHSLGPNFQKYWSGR